MHAGKKSFIWIGPNPIINILEPQMIKDVLFNYKTFQKPSTNPLSRLLVSGLLVLEGEKWAKHRKILSPAFSIDKIKVKSQKFSEYIILKIDIQN